MQQNGEQTKKTSSVFIRNISQQFGATTTNKSTCKYDSKDLDQLNEVHLVSSRRQLFEENADFKVQSSKSYYQNQNGNSNAKRESALTKKTEVNHDFQLRTPLRSSRASYKERKSNALDDHTQNNDDHNNNAIVNKVQNEQDKVEVRDSSYFTSDSDSTCDGKDIAEYSCKDESEAHHLYDVPVLSNNAHEEESDNNKKRKPRLSRFTRLSLKKQKSTSDSNTEQQSDDEDDIFGRMISDNDDYFLEVINGDSGVVLNKISLQRVCISNVLLNAPQNPKQTPNDPIRIYVDEDETTNNLPENNITTTVYYDHNSNPRIEKVIDENKLHVIVNDEHLVPPPSPTLPHKRQNLIIKELLETEVTFIEGLRIIIEEYMAYFKEHPDTRYSNPSYLCSLFGNVEDIYAEAQKFYVDLQACDYNIEKLATTFLEHKNLFEVFVEYIKNKPTSQLFSLGFYHSAIKERHAQLQEKECLDLESYLLTPIQRLGRYILFMENLQKVTKAMDQVCVVLDEATDFLKREMRRADTFVAAVSIGNSAVDLTKQGSLVAKETFNIKKKYNSVVFLFQDIVVFTIPNQERTESYFYKASIEMSDLAIRSVQEQPLTFNLRSFSQSCSYEESPYSFELETSSENVKKKWVQAIENLLWEQLEKCKAEALSGETVSRKFSKAASNTNSSNHYKKKKQPEMPPTPSANDERRSKFYVEC